MMKVLLAVLACLLAVASSDEDHARLLASKTILNQMLVEGQDLTVLYNIFNVGGSAALDVQLADNSFPDTDFGIVQGSMNVRWARIAPGTNVSHSVVLQPLKAGYFNFTSAEMTYLPHEDATETQFGYTSAPGEGGILNSKDYDRKFSPHMLDWQIFGLMTLPSLGIPFVLWYSSKSKYESSKLKKN